MSGLVQLSMLVGGSQTPQWHRDGIDNIYTRIDKLSQLLLSIKPFDENNQRRLDNVFELLVDLNRAVNMYDIARVRESMASDHHQEVATAEPHLSYPPMAEPHLSYPPMAEPHPSYPPREKEVQLPRVAIHKLFTLVYDSRQDGIIRFKEVSDPKYNTLYAYIKSDGNVVGRNATTFMKQNPDMQSKVYIKNIKNARVFIISINNIPRLCFGECVLAGGQNCMPLIISHGQGRNEGIYWYALPRQTPDCYVSPLQGSLSKIDIEQLSKIIDTDLWDFLVGAKDLDIK